MNKKGLRVPDYIGHMLDAVVRNIEVIGEAARNIATQAPDYTAIVWQVIERDLPALEIQLASLVPPS